MSDSVRFLVAYVHIQGHKSKRAPQSVKEWGAQIDLCPAIGTSGDKMIDLDWF